MSNHFFHYITPIAIIILPLIIYVIFFLLWKEKPVDKILSLTPVYLILQITFFLTIDISSADPAEFLNFTCIICVYSLLSCLSLIVRLMLRISSRDDILFRIFHVFISIGYSCFPFLLIAASSIFYGVDIIDLKPIVFNLILLCLLLSLASALHPLLFLVSKIFNHIDRK